MDLDEIVREKFPNLSPGEYRETSPEDPGYNCIAWAAGDDRSWWEPIGFLSNFWPSDAPVAYTLDAYVEAFRSLGYELCDDGEYEEKKEKIALFANEEGVPTHAARQIDPGIWTSKLGPSYDISHPLRGLESDEYGTVQRFMEREVDA